MVLIPEMPAVGRGFISRLEPPNIEEHSWINPKASKDRKVSVVSTAAVSNRGEKPFSWLARDYRTIKKTDRDLVMTHVAAEYDRTAWQQDLNTIMPVQGVIVPKLAAIHCLKRTRADTRHAGAQSQV